MKYSCEITPQLQAELNATVKRGFLISLIVGCVGLASYIALSMFFEGYLVNLLLWVSALLFGFGLVFLITVNKSNKNASTLKLSGEYELEPEYMMITSFKNGENIGNMKVYYKDIVKTKETENYIFLYPNPHMAYPVPKNKLSAEERLLLRAWLDAAKAKK